MSKEYLHTKNYIHNELGISKERIEEMMHKYIEKSVNDLVNSKLDNGWIEALIVKKIGSVITGKDSRYNDVTADHIKDVIRQEVKTEVVKRINFTSIDVK